MCILFGTSWILSMVLIKFCTLLRYKYKPNFKKPHDFYTVRGYNVMQYTWYVFHSVNPFEIIHSTNPNVTVHILFFNRL